MTPLCLNGFEQRSFNNQKTGKTGSRFEKQLIADKYYQVAKQANCCLL